MVLIYPYWNVNFVHRRRGTANSNVLIYPYWNVNCIVSKSAQQAASVLIYPYWNVNKRWLSHRRDAARFNLSILECKLVNTLPLRNVNTVLIYPYWNVNLHLP